MKITKGIAALTTKDEQREITVVGKKKLVLQYLKGSAKMGLRLWNVLSPQLPEYKYGPDSGFPTFSLQTLKEKGLV